VLPLLRLRSLCRLLVGRCAALAEVVAALLLRSRRCCFCCEDFLTVAPAEMTTDYLLDLHGRLQQAMQTQRQGGRGQSSGSAGLGCAGADKRSCRRDVCLLPDRHLCHRIQCKGGAAEHTAGRVMSEGSTGSETASERIRPAGRRRSQLPTFWCLHEQQKEREASTGKELGMRTTGPERSSGSVALSAADCIGGCAVESSGIITGRLEVTDRNTRAAGGWMSRRGHDAEEERSGRRRERQPLRNQGTTEGSRRRRTRLSSTREALRAERWM
jgi:hypothetical protein